MNNSSILYTTMGSAGRLARTRTFANKKSLLTLLIGLICGFVMAILFINSNAYLNREGVFVDEHCQFRSADLGDLDGVAGTEQDVVEHSDTYEAHAHENNTIELQLVEKVKVLCWIMTNPNNHKSRAIHVKRTWGSRCNKLIFMSSATDEEMECVALPVNEGRDHLWLKTKEAFKYVYRHHLNEYDWFMKADDDTYVIVENLRFMLARYYPEDPIYFGCKFKPFVDQGYMSGGAGYVLSREAVRRFVEVALPNSTLCRQDNAGDEDVEIGKCLEQVHVFAGDSRDVDLRERFFPFRPEYHLLPGLVDKSYFWNYKYYPTDDGGIDCCSDNAISFHYISPKSMYVMDYLIYHLKPYGQVSLSQKLSPKISVEQLIAELNKPKNVTNETIAAQPQLKT